ncbi:MAG: hypothetical protein ACYTG5_00470 [Planctomycetota bacterium]|jgi:hypothetical protein
MKQLLVPFLSGLLAMAVAVPEARCQKKPIPRPGKRAAQQVKGDSRANYLKEQGKQHVFEDPGEEYQPGTNVPLNKRVAIKGLGNFVQAFVGTDPGRLAPGQSGELRVVLALKGKYVMEEGAHVSLRYRRQQGKVSLGQWRLLPASIGKLNTTFRGRRVYDNTATITIPVSIGSESMYGQKNLGLEVEVDVSNGETGGFHGRYMMDVRAKLEVGRPLPTIKADDSEPDVAAPVVGVDSSNSMDASRGSVARDGDLSPEPVSGEELVGAGSGDLQAGPRNSGPDSTAENLTSSEGGINWLLWSVPGAFLLLLLAMALRKGKS